MERNSSKNVLLTYFVCSTYYEHKFFKANQLFFFLLCLFFQNFKNLKFIDLSFSKDLIGTPNFFEVPNLESLILEGCSNLIEIHQFVGQLRKLVVLNLKESTNLKYLPSKLETTSLKVFIFVDAQKFKIFLSYGEYERK